MTGMRAIRTGLVLTGALVLARPTGGVRSGQRQQRPASGVRRLRRNIRGSGNGAVLDELERSGKQIKVRRPILGSKSSTTTVRPGQ